MAERGRHRAGAGAHDREPRRPRQAVRCPEPTRAGPTNTHPSLPDGLSRPASAVLRRCNGTIHTVRPPGTRPGGRRSATRGASRSCVPPGVIHSLRCAAPMLSWQRPLLVAAQQPGSTRRPAQPRRLHPRKVAPGLALRDPAHRDRHVAVRGGPVPQLTGGVVPPAVDLAAGHQDLADASKWLRDEAGRPWNWWELRMRAAG
jgi:hypothetical protein